MRPTHKFDHGLVMPPGSQGEPDERPVYLVGIDDTDSLDSPGTGFHARQLGRRLHEEGVASLLDITRHQLLFDPRVRYTSHNSSLCLRLRVADEAQGRLVELCRSYLLAESVEGSDAGLCIMKWDDAPVEVEAFGYRAKTDVLDLDAARALGGKTLHFEGLTGDHGGMIGALAAVGLRRSDRDGRIAWLPGIRETTGIVTAGELLANTGIDEIWPLDGGDDATVETADRIDVAPWPRAVLIEGKAVLLVQKAGSDHDDVQWRLAAKSILKSY